MVNIIFSLLKIVFSNKLVQTIFLFMSILSSTSLFAQNTALLKSQPETRQANQKTTQTVKVSPKNLLKETRQVLQLAEYIGVDYPAAVQKGEISNKSEFAEMKQFSTIIVDKIHKLSASNASLIAASLTLQQAVNNKSPSTVIQKYSQAIRQQLLAISPNLVLPQHLLPSEQTQALFKNNCAMCHGETGRGNGLLAKTLTPKPTDFTDQSRAINRSLLGLYDVITNGLDGGAMRSFKHLNKRQRWSLAFYVGGFAFKSTINIDKNNVNKNNAQKSVSSEQLSKISLSKWINNNPSNLIQQNTNITLAQIATLRSDPSPLFKQSKTPLQITKRNLLAAVAAYKAEQLAQAQTLAVSAYLDGFELVENNLDAHDSILRKNIESQLLNFRNLLNTANQPVKIDQELTKILQKLQQAEQLLTEKGLSNDAIYSAATIILLREGLEALLIIIALATVLMKTKRRDAMKYLHLGWILALIAGIFTWWAAENLISISGASRELMEGGAALLAAFVLFYVGYWMQGKTQAVQWQHYIKTNLDRHLNSGTLWGIAGLAFISVYREIFETVLFYQSLLAQSNAEQLSYLSSGLFSGIAILAIIAWLMIRYSVRLPITQFFKVSTYFMLILAFVLTGKGVAALQEAGIIEISPFPIDISISWLGISATWQGLLSQASVIILAALLMFKSNKNYNKSINKTINNNKISAT